MHQVSAHEIPPVSVDSLNTNVKINRNGQFISKLNANGCSKLCCFDGNDVSILKHSFKNPRVTESIPIVTSTVLDSKANVTFISSNKDQHAPSIIAVGMGLSIIFYSSSSDSASKYLDRLLSEDKKHWIHISWHPSCHGLFAASKMGQIVIGRVQALASPKLEILDTISALCANPSRQIRSVWGCRCCFSLICWWGADSEVILWDDDVLSLQSDEKKTIDLNKEKEETDETTTKSLKLVRVSRTPFLFGMNGPVRAASFVSSTSSFNSKPEGGARSGIDSESTSMDDFVCAAFESSLDFGFDDSGHDPHDVSNYSIAMNHDRDGGSEGVSSDSDDVIDLRHLVLAPVDDSDDDDSISHNKPNVVNDTEHVSTSGSEAIQSSENEAANVRNNQTDRKCARESKSISNKRMFPGETFGGGPSAVPSFLILGQNTSNISTTNITILNSISSNCSGRSSSSLIAGLSNICRSDIAGFSQHPQNLSYINDPSRSPSSSFVPQVSNQTNVNSKSNHNLNSSLQVSPAKLCLIPGCWRHRRKKCAERKGTRGSGMEPSEENVGFNSDAPCTYDGEGNNADTRGKRQVFVAKKNSKKDRGAHTPHPTAKYSYAVNLTIARPDLLTCENGIACVSGSGSGVSGVQVFRISPSLGLELVANVVLQNPFQDISNKPDPFLSGIPGVLSGSTLSSAMGSNFRPRNVGPVANLLDLCLLMVAEKVKVDGTHEFRVAVRPTVVALFGASYSPPSSAAMGGFSTAPGFTLLSKTGLTQHRFESLNIASYRLDLELFESFENENICESGNLKSNLIECYQSNTTDIKRNDILKINTGESLGKDAADLSCKTASVLADLAASEALKAAEMAKDLAEEAKAAAAKAMKSAIAASVSTVEVQKRNEAELSSETGKVVEKKIDGSSLLLDELKCLMFDMQKHIDRRFDEVNNRIDNICSYLDHVQKRSDDSFGKKLLNEKG